MKEFLDNINKPLGMSPHEILVNLHLSDPPANESEEEDESQRPVLSLELYFNLENDLEKVTDF